MALGTAGVQAAVKAEPSPRTVTTSAADGAVAATFSYLEGGTSAEFSDLRLTIARGGAGYHEAPVSSHYCNAGCFPEPLGGGPGKHSPLAVADVEGDGQPAVVLGLSTGGAHCCTVIQIFSFDPGTMTYRSVERDFGDSGALLGPLEGHSEEVFQSADDRFAYEFAPYAYSALPLQVWRLREGHFVNVTRLYPKAIAADAARAFNEFVAARREAEGNGPIAAWAADQYLLGHPARARAVLSREASHDRLRSRERYGPSGKAFVKALERFLRRSGYG